MTWGEVKPATAGEVQGQGGEVRMLIVLQGTEGTRHTHERIVVVSDWRRSTRAVAAATAAAAAAA